MCMRLQILCDFSNKTKISNGLQQKFTKKIRWALTATSWLSNDETGHNQIS